MIVNLVGMQELKGTSKKTGRPYDLIVAYCTMNKHGVSGMATTEVTINPKNLVEPLTIGEQYNVDRDERGFVVAFEPIG